MPNLDILIDFYRSGELEHAVAKYKLLTELIADDGIELLDSEPFWEGQSSLKSTSWTYIATPLLRHPLQEVDNQNNDKFIQFLPIPPLHDVYYKSSVSNQAIPTIDHLLFLDLVLCVAEYESMFNARLDNLVMKTKEKIQSVFTLLVTFYQHKKISSWWELTERAGVSTPYSAYGELLPPLIGSEVITSKLQHENQDFSEIKNALMPDSDNVLLAFDQFVAHFTLSTLAKGLVSASQLKFCCLRDEYYVFFHEDGFLQYFWKERRWTNDPVDDVECIIFSPEDDDYIFHLNKKLAVEIPELTDQTIIKIKDPTGYFALMMDKEAHGGIYDLRTLFKVVDTGQLNWYDEVEEIQLKNLEEGLRNIENKVAAFWVGGSGYKLIAYGRLIVNNKLVRRLPETIHGACFSPNGDYLVLLEDKRGVVLETANYTPIRNFG
ncbi:hypothetical protein C900_01838 [Fulvivirga imtechensis AK7]|uniref:Uncharacterized protein n=1 Tax=Fulvivirga imtechensis AK7 TaxID=1237149 RepID=L8JSZ2_9BACT|nr:hypothetical protein [Fulvivirga imtechensis]ELR72096.1 hypothetical protein C900_01838 [Fulvivirga imtechensis AK7]